MAQASSEQAAGAAAVLVTLPDCVDLHARPAADFVRTAMGFSAAIQVAANGREANAKSLLTVLALGAKGGTAVEVEVSGDGAAETADTIAGLLAGLSE